ncbi:DUF2975 domain-containing protein [Phycicoccus flavus]|uniref:DUF2975 domain-containing protein n=1 Tax=Phycicoccus flavus TaxID=2502783 RepID=A0A8T6RBN1_9MICO|nr:DUF2975 domain-containing protein [Phycicoccus flavus]NHA69561.1 DUF2975 domain-containing protein [Phycicoccus flavus]
MSSRLSRLLTFDRTDRYGLGVLLALVVLVQLVVRVVLPVADWLRGEPVRVPLLSAVEVPALDAVGTAHGEGVYDVLVDASAGQRAAVVAVGVMTVALVAVAAWLVLAVMRSIASGDPFGPATVGRLRLLAAVLVIGAPVLTAAELPVQGWMLGTLDLGGLDPATPVDAPWQAVVGGLVVALLAEAFVVGRRLREDVEGLV